MPPKSPWRKRLPLILAVPGAILALTLIWTFFFPKEAKVAAYGECSDFTLPDSSYSQLQALTTAPDIDAILKVLPENIPDRNLLALSIGDLFTKGKPTNLQSDLQGWHSRCKFVVNNAGSKEAQGVTLQFRMNGTYRLELAKSLRRISLKMQSPLETYNQEQALLLSPGTICIPYRRHFLTN